MGDNADHEVRPRGYPVHQNVDLSGLEANDWDRTAERAIRIARSVGLVDPLFGIWVESADLEPDVGVTRSVDARPQPAVVLGRVGGGASGLTYLVLPENDANKAFAYALAPHHFPSLVPGRRVLIRLLGPAVGLVESEHGVEVVDLHPPLLASLVARMEEVDSGIALTRRVALRWIRVLFCCGHGDTLTALAVAAEAPHAQVCPRVLAAAVTRDAVMFAAVLDALTAKSAMRVFHSSGAEVRIATLVHELQRTWALVHGFRFARPVLAVEQIAALDCTRSFSGGPQFWKLLADLADGPAWASARWLVEVCSRFRGIEAVRAASNGPDAVMAAARIPRDVGADAFSRGVGDQLRAAARRWCELVIRKALPSTGAVDAASAHRAVEEWVIFVSRRPALDTAPRPSASPYAELPGPRERSAARQVAAAVLLSINPQVALAPSVGSLLALVTELRDSPGVAGRILSRLAHHALGAVSALLSEQCEDPGPGLGPAAELRNAGAVRSVAAGFRAPCVGASVRSALLEVWTFETKDPMGRHRVALLRLIGACAERGCTDCRRCLTGQAEAWRTRQDGPSPPTVGSALADGLCTFAEGTRMVGALLDRCVIHDPGAVVRGPYAAALARFKGDLPRDVERDRAYLTRSREFSNRVPGSGSTPRSFSAAAVAAARTAGTVEEMATSVLESRRGFPWEYRAAANVLGVSRTDAALPSDWPDWPAPIRDEIVARLWSGPEGSLAGRRRWIGDVIDSAAILEPPSAEVRFALDLLAADLGAPVEAGEGAGDGLGRDQLTALVAAAVARVGAGLAGHRPGWRALLVPLAHCVRRLVARSAGGQGAGLALHEVARRAEALATDDPGRAAFLIAAQALLSGGAAVPDLQGALERCAQKFEELAAGIQAGSCDRATVRVAALAAVRSAREHPELRRLETLPNAHASARLRLVGCGLGEVDHALGPDHWREGLGEIGPFLRRMARSIRCLLPAVVTGPKGGSGFEPLDLGAVAEAVTVHVEPGTGLVSSPSIGMGTALLFAGEVVFNARRHADGEPTLLLDAATVDGWLCARIHEVPMEPDRCAAIRSRLERHLNSAVLGPGEGRGLFLLAQVWLAVQHIEQRAPPPPFAATVRDGRASATWLLPVRYDAEPAEKP